MEHSERSMKLCQAARVLSKQAEFAINKLKKLVSSFKFLRKYLTKDQVLKAASVHFYRAVFYAIYHLIELKSMP